VRGGGRGEGRRRGGGGGGGGGGEGGVSKAHTFAWNRCSTFFSCCREGSTGRLRITCDSEQHHNVSFCAQPTKRMHVLE